MVTCFNYLPNILKIGKPYLFKKGGYKEYRYAVPTEEQLEKLNTLLQDTVAIPANLPVLKFQGGSRCFFVNVVLRLDVDNR